ncbi:hypothetical protein FACS18942_06880 [Planctomycetales bacterium]|nr:hypothetical protein FACS18942_06880 [Planctomycetales bacterium]
MTYFQRFIFLFGFILLSAFSAAATAAGSDGLFVFAEEGLSAEDDFPSTDDFRITPNGVHFQTDTDLFLGQKQRRRGSGGRFWTNLYYGATTLKPKDTVRIKPDEYGVQFGFDVVQTHGIYSTFLGNFQRSSVKIQDTAKSTAETYTIGYGKFAYLRGCHFGGLGTISYDKYKISRSTVGSNGDGKGVQTNIFGEFGIDFVLPRFAIKPFYALQYDFLYHGRIGEKGSEFQDDWNGDGLTQLFGSKFNIGISDSIELQIRTTWVHELLDPQPFFNARFGPVQGTMTPAIFYYNGYTGRDWAWLGASFKWEICYNVFLFLDYDATINKYHTTNFGNIGLCLGW